MYKIKSLIEKSKYSIHDLSRIDPLTKTDLPRFNMAFECGIEFGMRLARPDIFEKKKILILEKEQYRYQKVISDIAGNDIKAHKNNPQQLIKVIRDWFKLNLGNVPGYREIWLAYNEFIYEFEEILTIEGYDPGDINSLTFSDIIDFINTWIRKYKKIP